MIARTEGELFGKPTIEPVTEFGKLTDGSAAAASIATADALS